MQDFQASLYLGLEYIGLISCIHAEEFSIYLQYARKLGFEETPDYDFLRDLFTKVLVNLNETDDEIYDWMKGQPKQPEAYERQRVPMVKDVDQQQQQQQQQISRKIEDRQGNLHQFVSCISCGLFSCF